MGVVCGWLDDDLLCYSKSQGTSILPEHKNFSRARTYFTVVLRNLQRTAGSTLRYIFVILCSFCVLCKRFSCIIFQLALTTTDTTQHEIRNTHHTVYSPFSFLDLLQVHTRIIKRPIFTFSVFIDRPPLNLFKLRSLRTLVVP